MANYGDSFGIHENGSVKINRINVWDKINEIYPGGAVLAAGGSYTEGTIIPAGTPVSAKVPGGAATLNSTTPIGFTMKDTPMGAKCCTLTIVTRGTLLESRVKATITATQKKAVAGQIIFIKETV